ncbi:NAD(P)-binding protein [Aspergillus novofumigatus IBT 16806]|uniref:NAD(P)-binding protein n=1 Tax=Aspergillus novofumigatus (strain IBT 16806) TaxID=1392255 RepID=A0A2I1BTJ2_ASPN1|nr:NAD(P)-binding protein [Aspergillus novofumigatus IBT 16806]PKX88689.1 NAD(P)-binding protein [Aspergillus novofumigatus IBT 16806]
MSNIWDMIRVVVFGSNNDASRNGAPAFNPAQDIPSMAGKVIFITGAAGDLGRQTAIELARYGRPSRIYIADLPRTDDAKQALIRQIDSEAYGDSIRFLELDLASFESVRKCAQQFAAQEQHLDILILNAGIIRVPPITTPEGYEIHFGVNYLGHALLTRLLMPMLLRTTQRESGADARVVVVSSEGHVSAPKQGVDFELVKTNCSNLPYPKRYGQSKAALIGLMQGLSRDYPQIKTVAVHPGRILTGMATSLWKESTLARLTKPIAPFFCVPVTTGIRNHLWAATSSEVVSGTYYEPVGVPGTLSQAVQDPTFATRLKEWTDNALEGIKPLE